MVRFRIAARSAVFGFFNRRFGMPIVDVGTIRLPRIIGHGRALELILTGRPVDAEEALRIGLVNELTEDGEALARAVALAQTLCDFPQTAMRNDRRSAIEQWDPAGRRRSPTRSPAGSPPSRAGRRCGMGALPGRRWPARQFVSEPE